MAILPVTTTMSKTTLAKRFSSLDAKGMIIILPPRHSVKGDVEVGYV